MKWLFAFIIPLMVTGPMVEFDRKLAPDYRRALQYLETHKEQFNRALPGSDQARAIMVSVVFPEMVRYSLVRDLLETKTLEVGYVRKGKSFVDFSIGRFQMKPSFVEHLEEYLRSSGKLSHQYADLFNYGEQEATARRRGRIERLKTLEWQLIYLRAFYDAVKIEFPWLEGQSLSYRIQFIATAYNHGFTSSKQELEKWMHTRCYPYGTELLGKQYAYSQVSLYFWRKHFNTIFNNL